MFDLEAARYPVGRFTGCSVPPSAVVRADLIDAIERTPAIVRALVEGLSDAELETPYRDGGWTIRQVVHHMPDSHLNAYVRMKLAVTEDTPTIKPYAEDKWAELEDGRTAPAAVSLDLLEALHRRWVVFLRALTDVEFSKTFVHPALGEAPIYDVLARYAWHGRHHIAHIRLGLGRIGRA